MPGVERIYRRRGTVIIGAVGVSAVVVVWVWLVYITILDSRVSAWDKATSCTYLLPGIWFMRRMAIRPRVEVGPTLLAVVNPLFAYAIPYRAIKKVSTEDGLTIVTSEEEIPVVAFSKSFLADWLGNTGRDVADCLRERTTMQSPPVKGGLIQRSADLHFFDMVFCVLPVINLFLAAAFS